MSMVTRDLGEYVIKCVCFALTHLGCLSKKINKENGFKKIEDTS